MECSKVYRVRTGTTNMEACVCWCSLLAHFAKNAWALGMRSVRMPAHAANSLAMQTLQCTRLHIQRLALMVDQQCGCRKSNPFCKALHQVSQMRCCHTCGYVVLPSILLDLLLHCQQLLLAAVTLPVPAYMIALHCYSASAGVACVSAVYADVTGGQAGQCISSFQFERKCTSGRPAGAGAQKVNTHFSSAFLVSLLAPMRG